MYTLCHKRYGIKETRLGSTFHTTHVQLIRRQPQPLRQCFSTWGRDPKGVVNHFGGVAT